MSRRSDWGPGVPSPRPAADDIDELADSLRWARQGDESAFADLYRNLQPRLFRYALALVGSDAEDVTAEAWLQIARDLRSFVGDGHAFRAWTATIVRHRALDLRRAQSRRPVDVVDDACLTQVAGGGDTQAEVEHRLSTESAIALIATLPRDQAEAVLLRVVMGLDAAAAAQVLGKKAGAVRVAAHRGLRTLTRTVEQRAERVGRGHV